MKEDQIVQICKALGDPNRLKIVKLLTNGQMCACKLLEVLDITQPTLSHHMKLLCECNLVKVKKDGKWSHYSLSEETLNNFKDFIANLSCDKDESGACNSSCC